MDYSKFVVVEESTYSSLLPYASKQVYVLLHARIGNFTDVIDATAHVGVDTVNFITRFGANCISLEVNKDAYDCLVENVTTFGGAFSPNHTIHCNCMDFLKEFKKKMDFVYFDPPWGGPGYRKEKSMMLYLEHKEKKIAIHDVVNFVFKQGFTSTVVLKAPQNFDFQQFSQGLKGKFTQHNVMKPKKNKARRAYVAFYLVICEV